MRLYRDDIGTTGPYYRDDRGANNSIAGESNRKSKMHGFMGIGCGPKSLQVTVFF